METMDSDIAHCRGVSKSPQIYALGSWNGAAHETQAGCRLRMIFRRSEKIGAAKKGLDTWRRMTPNARREMANHRAAATEQNRLFTAVLTITICLVASLCSPMIGYDVFTPTG